MIHVVLAFVITAALQLSSRDEAMVQRAFSEKSASLRVVVESLEARSRSCVPSSVEAQKAERSGRVAVKLVGRGCSEWIWAQVRVYGPAVVARSALREGDSLEGRVSVEERERVGGFAPLTELPSSNARARRTIAEGRTLSSVDVALDGALPGAPIRVLVQRGPLTVEADGTVVSSSGATCARLAGARRVCGEVRDGALWVVTR